MPQVIAPFNSLGVRDPNTGEPLRVGDGLEEVAIDPANGNLYVVWESSTNYQKQLKQSSGAWDNQIVLVRSTDGGQSWIGPTVIHTASGLPTFTPTVAVNNGIIAVTYYDTRNLTPNQTGNLPTDYWVEYSTNAGTSFGNEQRITQKPCDATDSAGQVFPTGGACAPARSTSTVTSNTNPTDAFFATVSP